MKIYLDIIYLALLAAFAALKYISMIINSIIWPVKYGKKYSQFLKATKITPCDIYLARVRYGRTQLGFGKLFLQCKYPLNKILLFLYRFPVLFIIIAISIGIFSYLDFGEVKVIILIILLLIGLFVQVSARIITRIFLGKLADFDESVNVRIPAPIVDNNWIKNAPQRFFILFLVDILVFLFSFSFIYFGINYYYSGKICGQAFTGIDNPIGFFQWIDFVFFSLATFTTTGFGDIAAKAGCTLARTIIGIQMFLGFLYVVALLQLFSTRDNY